MYFMRGSPGLRQAQLALAFDLFERERHIFQMEIRETTAEDKAKRHDGIGGDLLRQRIVAHEYVMDTQRRESALELHFPLEAHGADPYGALGGINGGEKRCLR